MLNVKEPKFEPTCLSGKPLVIEPKDQITGVTPRVRLLSLPVSLDRKVLSYDTANYPEVLLATTVLTFLMSFLSLKRGSLS